MSDLGAKLKVRLFPDSYSTYSSCYNSLWEIMHDEDLIFFLASAIKPESYNRCSLSLRTVLISV